MIEIEIEVDSSGLDIALEKADRLRTCLKEVSQLLKSMQNKDPEGIQEPNNGMLSTQRRLQTIGIDLGPSVGNTDQIMEDLAVKLKEWTEHAAR